ncbi:MAG: FadR family transcriptional regulator [Pseudogulbenkiania sp.]|nr:FadR family transcriptional regulator [Pseudogulbenkiania sp.]
MQLRERIPVLVDDVNKRTVREQITDKLAYMICTGLLMIGDELPSERELAGMFNVSRETVRGGIQALAARGMVTISHGARTRIISNEGYSLQQVAAVPRNLKGYSLETVYAARRVVELEVVRDAAQRINQSTLKRLQSLLNAQAGMFDDPVRFQISDREFHTLIYEACSNPLLGTFVSDLYAFALDFRRKAMSKPGAVRQSYEDHLAIFDGLLHRDPEATARAIAQHLDHVHLTTVNEMEP